MLHDFNYHLCSIKYAGGAIVLVAQLAMIMENMLYDQEYPKLVPYHISGSGYKGTARSTKHLHQGLRTPLLTLT